MPLTLIIYALDAILNAQPAQVTTIYRQTKWFATTIFPTVKLTKIIFVQSVHPNTTFRKLIMPVLLISLIVKYTQTKSAQNVTHPIISLKISKFAMKTSYNAKLMITWFVQVAWRTTKSQKTEWFVNPKSKTVNSMTNYFANNALKIIIYLRTK